MPRIQTHAGTSEGVTKAWETRRRGGSEQDDEDEAEDEAEDGRTRTDTAQWREGTAFADKVGLKGMMREAFKAMIRYDSPPATEDFVAAAEDFGVSRKRLTAIYSEFAAERSKNKPLVRAGGSGRVPGSAAARGGTRDNFVRDPTTDDEKPKWMKNNSGTLDIFESNMSNLVKNGTWDGQDCWIVPTVLMPVGVHNGLLYNDEALAKSAVGWNGRDVVVWHPRDDQGTPVTANTPQRLEKSTVGRVFDCAYDSDINKLKGNSYIIKSRARAVSPTLCRMIENGERIEVSTGVYVDEVGDAGVWNEEQYRAIATNHRPDHLALLPGGRGAATWEDGAGAPRINTEDKEPMFCGNDQSMGERMREISEAATKQFRGQGGGEVPVSTGGYCSEVYDDYVIMQRDGKTFRVPYEMNKDDEPEFGEPEQVVERKVYEPVANAGTSEGAEKGWETRKGGGAEGESGSSGGSISHADLSPTSRGAERLNDPKNGTLSSEGGFVASLDKDGGVSMYKVFKAKEGWVVDSYSQYPKEDGFTKTEGMYIGKKSLPLEEVVKRAKIEGARFKVVVTSPAGTGNNKPRANSVEAQKVYEPVANAGTSEGVTKSWETRKRGGGVEDDDDADGTDLLPEDEKYNTGAPKARDEDYGVGASVRIGQRQGGGKGVVVGFDRDGSFAMVRVGGKYKSFHNSDLTANQATSPAGTGNNKPRANSVEAQRGGKIMDRKAQIDALIASGGRWGEESRDYLVALEDDTFVRVTAEETPATNDEVTTLRAEVKALREAKPSINAEQLPAEAQRAIRREKDYQARLVGELKANARCKFGEDKLKVMDIDTLETLAASLDVEVDYSARSAGAAAPAANDSNKIEPTPALNWAQPTK